MKKFILISLTLLYASFGNAIDHTFKYDEQEITPSGDLGERLIMLIGSLSRAGAYYVTYPTTCGLMVWGYQEGYNYKMVISRAAISIRITPVTGDAVLTTAGRSTSTTSGPCDSAEPVIPPSGFVFAPEVGQSPSTFTFDSYDPYDVPLLDSSGDYGCQGDRAAHELLAPGKHTGLISCDLDTFPNEPYRIVSAYLL